jgi:hypothetical protein
VVGMLLALALAVGLAFFGDIDHFGILLMVKETRGKIMSIRIVRYGGLSEVLRGVDSGRRRDGFFLYYSLLQQSALSSLRHCSFLLHA